MVDRLESQKAGIIGCGNMGRAILKAIVDNRVYTPSQLYVADSREDQLKTVAPLKVNAVDNISLAKKCDVIILSVKPKDVSLVAKEIKDFIDEEKVLISIAAGLPTEKIESCFAGKAVPVIRVMPNLNIKVNAGLLPYCLGKYARRSKHLVEKIFSFSGFVFELREDKFDAITAISGSGPGFIFFIGEVINSICKSRGFSAEEADLISAYIIYGSGKMMVDTKTAPSVLKKMVSSPGGTTLAGLNVFMERGLQSIFEEAIEKAEKRSKELSETL